MANVYLVSLLNRTMGTETVRITTSTASKSQKRHDSITSITDTNF